jgi:hypothetical protein
MRSGGNILISLHARVGEGHCVVRGTGDAQFLQRILKAHDGESHRPVAQLRRLGLREGVEIDVDDVVQHPHRNRHRSRRMFKV